MAVGLSKEGGLAKSNYGDERISVECSPSHPSQIEGGSSPYQLNKEIKRRKPVHNSRTTFGRLNNKEDTDSSDATFMSDECDEKRSYTP